MKNGFTAGGDRAGEDLPRLRRLVALAPHDTELRLDLARELLECWRAEEAIAEIRGLIAMVPNHLEARKLLARAHALQLSRPM